MSNKVEHIETMIEKNNIVDFSLQDTFVTEDGRVFDVEIVYKQRETN